MNKFPLSFSSLKCPLKVKKLSRENSAKNVSQTSNQNVKPPFLRQYLIFFFNNFFCIQKSHFDHYFNRKPLIWRKLPIWRYTVTLSHIYRSIFILRCFKKLLLKSFLNWYLSASLILLENIFTFQRASILCFSDLIKHIQFRQITFIVKLW